MFLSTDVTFVLGLPVWLVRRAQRQKTLTYGDGGPSNRRPVTPAGAKSRTSLCSAWTVLVDRAAGTQGGELDWSLVEYGPGREVGVESSEGWTRK